MELALASKGEQYGRTVHRQLATFEALRRLGFSPDEIFVCWECSSPRTVVRSEGKSFSISYPESREHSAVEAEWMEEWLREANRWRNEMMDDERSGIYRSHISGPVLGLLSLALRARGFRIRRAEN